MLQAGGFTRLFRIHWRCIDISTDWMINEEIRDREVRLIGADGAQLGVMPTAKALELAEQQELDLVKIVPGAVPPVCKLLDYDKHRFEQSKREKEMRKNQKTVELKEVQLSATIEENDVAVKARNAAKFLGDGNKVKVSIRFRGRQIAHSDIGLKVMQDFIERVQDLCVVEKRPMMEGRNMFMVLAPKTDKASKGQQSPKPAPAPKA
jgi:translation initiation factor IF-3